MDTIKLSGAVVAGGEPSRPRAQAAPHGPRPDSSSGIRIGTGRFDGTAWTYCDGYARLLERVPARCWERPAEQDWRLVKRNGARDVYRAVIDGRAYYLKYYRRRRWSDGLTRLFRQPACLAEWNGGVYAQRFGIPAVRPVAFTLEGRCEGRRCALLVSEAIEPSYPLSEFWLAVRGDRDARRSREDKRHLIDLLAQTIARAHQSGFEHTDMHAENILIRPVAPRRYQAAFVDLQSARLGVPVTDRAVVRNLAQLNQWFRRHSTIGDRVRFLRAYIRWRHEFEHEFAHARPLGLSFRQLFRALVAAADRHAERLWARRDRRVRRDGRYFARLRIGAWRGMAAVCSKRANSQSPASAMVLDRAWWEQTLADPLRWLGDASELCKDSHSACVAQTVLHRADGDLAVIIKRPLARNWRRLLRQLLPPSRCRRGWNVAYALLNRDIRAARPLAYLERRRFGLITDSLLITERLAGAAELDAFLKAEHARRAPDDWAALKRELTESLVRHVRLLHERGFEHRDCKAQNIVVVRADPVQLFWIDMDGVRHRRRVRLTRQLRALMRLHVSLLDVPGLTRSDRARFLKAYFARHGGDPGAWRQAWRQIASQTAGKLAAQQARRAWKLAHYGRQ